jgi:chromosome segregation ATPase
MNTIFTNTSSRTLAASEMLFAAPASIADDTFNPASPFSMPPAFFSPKYSSATRHKLDFGSPSFYPNPPSPIDVVTKYGQIHSDCEKKEPDIIANAEKNEKELALAHAMLAKSQAKLLVAKQKLDHEAENTKKMAYSADEKIATLIRATLAAKGALEAQLRQAERIPLLEMEISSKDEEIDSLRAELTKIQNELHSLEVANRNLQAQLAELQHVEIPSIKALAAADLERYKKCEGSLLSHQLQLHEVSAQLNLIMIQYHQLESERFELKTALSASTRIEAQLSQDLDKRSAAFENATAELAQQTQQNFHLKQQHNRISEQMTQHVTDLNKTNKKIEKEFNSIVSQCDELRLSNDYLSSEIKVPNKLI